MYIKLLFLLCFLVFATGCVPSQEAEAYQSEFFAMDTVIYFTLYGDGAKEAALSAEREVYRLEGLFSAQRADSEIALANANGNAELSAESTAVLGCALDLYEQTKGAFDVSVYPLMMEWGFFSKDYAVLSQERIASLLPLVGSDGITLEANTLALSRPGTGIDLGAIGKGYASDRAAAVLREAGIVSGILSLGGNVCALGSKPDGAPWSVAIADPFAPQDVIGSLLLEDGFVVTSGGYQRYFTAGGVNYHHILDPRTGYPAKSGLASVTIVCGSGMLADGLSTSLFVMGEAEALRFWRGGAYDFEAVLVRDDGSVIVTSGLSESYGGGAFEVAER
jgi:thiamine biosynthesis lipoprotein